MLLPYSETFSKELGYTVRIFEADFKISAGARVKPDAVLASNKLGCTLVAEWTGATSVSDDKKGQLDRYSKLVTDDLVNILALPPATVRSFAVSLIVRQDTLEVFEKFISEKGWPFPLLGFGEDGGQYSLREVHNRFPDASTENFFSRGIRVQRIPLRYIPFSLDDISMPSMVSLVVQHLVALLVKGVKEVSADDFCQGYVPVWKFIHVSKQNEVIRVTTDIMNQLLREPMGSQLAKRVRASPPEWQLIGSPEFKKRSRSYQKFLQEFIAKQRGDSYQPALFE